MITLINLTVETQVGKAYGSKECSAFARKKSSKKFWVIRLGTLLDPGDKKSTDVE